MNLKEMISEHFEKFLEMGLLLFIFIFGAVMLAAFPMREEMSRWIENGMVIGILAARFGARQAASKVNGNGTNGIKEGEQQ